MASELANEVGDAEISAAYAANASALKTVINDVLWDEEAEMYRDNELSDLHPQDGNSLAVLFNVTQTQEQNKAISQGLTQFWTDIGPLNPELNDTIIPFIGGFEVRAYFRQMALRKRLNFIQVQAHFIAGEGQRAIDLLHKGEIILKTMTNEMLTCVTALTRGKVLIITRRELKSLDSGDICSTPICRSNQPSWRASPPTVRSGKVVSHASHSQD